jgi:hypothetical protein
MKKINKKILIGILLVGVIFSLFLVNTTEAAIPPPIREPKASTEEGQVCGLAVCDWWDIGCLSTYILTIPVRVILLLIGAIGLGIGIIVIWLGFMILPDILNTIIFHSLGDTYLNTLNSLSIVKSMQDISLELIYLFLMIIGLATILKFIFPFAEYEAKKTLVPLIVFALLVHFAPQITIQIIKWGNSVTKALYATLSGEVGLQAGGTMEGDFLGAKKIGEDLMDVLINSSELVGRIFCIDGHIDRYFVEKDGFGPVIPMMILYGAVPWMILSITVFILLSYISFGLVFLMRTIFLIVLVIVSPIAFLTAAFRTKEIRSIFSGFLNWETWWQTLLEWAFIGIMLVIWLAVAQKFINERDLLFPGAPTTVKYDTVFKPSNVQNYEQLKSSIDFELLMKYLVPPLATAAAIFFASVSTPKLGQQFAGAAFGFLKQVGSALITGAIVGTAAVATAGAAAAAGGLAKAAGAFRQMGEAIRKRDWRGAGGAFVRGLGYTLVGAPVAGAIAIGREAAKFGIAKMPKYVTRAVVPKEIREEIAKYPILKRAKQFPWAKEFIEGISGRVRGGLTALAERHPQLFTFMFATPALDVRRAADVRNLARQYNISEDEMRRILTAMLRREVRRRIGVLPPSWQPP